MPSIPKVLNEGPPQTRAGHIRGVAEQVLGLVEDIPGFTYLTPNQVRRLTAAAAVSDEFMEVNAQAMESRPALAAAAKTQPVTLRVAVEDSHAIVMLTAVLERLIRGCRHTDTLLRGTAGTEAMRVYQVAQKMTRHGDLEDNSTWVQQMKVAWNRRRKKSTEAELAARRQLVRLPARRIVAELPAAEVPSATPDFKAGRDL
ncbi:MAG TPA: hypothetical protein VEK57_07130 [Thermoanaerobaculia bacterium]|nr:hypothetical protein [Thermoanaerobaculia bacterium]